MKIKKLYLISQSENNGYDTYDSAVVCAKSLDEARYISPSEYDEWRDGAWYFKYSNGRKEETPTGGDTWAHPDKVKVVLLGVAEESINEGIVCASFNAG